MVLDCRARKGLCEEGLLELSSEQHEPDHQGASLEKNNPGGGRSQASAGGAETNLARSGIRKQVGVSGAERAKRRAGETHPTTGHLKVLPSDSPKCHRDLPSAADPDPLTWKCVLFLFSFFLAGKKYEEERPAFEDNERDSQRNQGEKPTVGGSPLSAKIVAGRGVGEGRGVSRP